MKISFKGKVAVLTGAAGGIGAALARRLATQGADLALIDRDAAGLEALAAELHSRRARISQHVADLTDPAAIAALPQAVLAAHGGASLLINNAGAALIGWFDQVTEEDFRWLMEVNFWSGVRMTRAFLPLLRANSRASLVFLSSVFGLIAPPGETAYAASKFAIRGFAEALRHELEGSGIGVTIVHPGGIRTAIARNARVSAGIDPAILETGIARFEAALRTSPDQAAAAIAEGIARGRKRILIGSDARMIDALQRSMPARYWQALKRQFPEPATKPAP